MDMGRGGFGLITIRQQLPQMIHLRAENGIKAGNMLIIMTET